MTLLALPTALRSGALPTGERWLPPHAERAVVAALGALVGVAAEISLLYDDGSAVRPLPVCLTVVAGLALLVRRRRALLVLAGMLAATAGLFLLGDSPGGGLVMVALFTVAEERPTRVSVAALVVATAVLVGLSVTSVPPPVLVWAAGAALRSRRRHLAQSQAHAEAERVQRAAIAALEERTGIARELHDIVAHSVTVMLVGVRGARDVLDAQPATAADVLSRVESTGERSLIELRRLLALLRAPDPEGTRPPADLRPLPGVADLPALVEEFRSAGLPVALETAGDPGEVDEGVGLSVYRIVEEALTNVVRHAGSAPVAVRLEIGDGDLRLEVADDGTGRSAAPSDGHGLVGMRERAALLGGKLTVGPRAGGGFRVHVRLPLRAAA